jgi:thioredoxin 1
MTLGKRALRLAIPLVGGIFLGAVAVNCRREPSPVPSQTASEIAHATFQVTSANFQDEVLQSDQPVMVDLWAPWCAPCRQLAPVVAELGQEYQGRVKIGNLNIDEHPAISQRYEVDTIPTLLFFHNGKLLGRMWGVQSKSTIAAKLDEILAALN